MQIMFVCVTLKLRCRKNKGGKDMTSSKHSNVSAAVLADLRSQQMGSSSKQIRQKGGQN